MVGNMTPTKSPLPSRSRTGENSEVSENLNPNLSNGVCLQKSGDSPAIRSHSKLKKSASKNLERLGSSQIVAKRKFLVAKKNSKKASVTVTCKCRERKGDAKKCPCIAYQNLRASQEEFFRQHGQEPENLNDSNPESAEELDEKKVEEFGSVDESKTLNQESFGVINALKTQISDQYGVLDKSKAQNQENFGVFDGSETQNFEDFAVLNESETPKNLRNQLLEQAMNSIPEPGSGRVRHLVKAFESILSIPGDDSNDSKERGEKTQEIKKGLKWGLPGLQPMVPDVSATSATSSSSPSSFSSSELFKSKNLELNSAVYASIDSSDGSFGSKTSGGERRSRRNSSESSGKLGGRNWKRQLKVTSQQPFKLRTEQRGRFKEQEFLKKVQEMIEKEEQQRVPIAQGLPWTTDEPECLVKPPVKESTKPLDLTLHSDIRAVERAEFDHSIAEKITWIEQYRLEKEREERLAEEEEIKRLRKELEQRAQPMPYFDRPFIPKRSEKHPTIPREPKFHNPHHKKIKCMSWSDINIYQH